MSFVFAPWWEYAIDLEEYLEEYNHAAGSIWQDYITGCVSCLQDDMAEPSWLAGDENPTNPEYEGMQCE